MSSSILSTSLLVKQFIPARGRKRDERIPQSRQARNNSSPQGDGNPRVWHVWPYLSKQFIPARGRKHCFFLLLFLDSPKQFIPARGRKRYAACVQRGFQETIHPRKGTETCACPPCMPPTPETIHPRKGTETASRVSSSIALTRNNSSPQGDGNNQQKMYSTTASETIHPRKGTETRFREKTIGKTR
mgnify:CR=1 FL=1